MSSQSNKCTKFLSYDRTIRAKRAEKGRPVAEKELKEEQALFDQRTKQVLQCHCFKKVVAYLLNRLPSWVFIRKKSNFKYFALQVELQRVLFFTKYGAPKQPER